MSWLTRLFVGSALCIIMSSLVTALVVHIDLTVYANDTVSQDNVAVLEGEADEPLQSGDATIVLWQDEEHYRTNVALPFFALDPWRELDRTMVSINLPYIGNRGNIILFRNQSVLWSYDLAQLCDRNKACTGTENALSCSDCDADADRYCNLDSPGCDPDCRQGLDNDCAAGNTYLPYALLALLIAGLVVAYRILKKK